MKTFIKAYRHRNSIRITRELWSNEMGQLAFEVITTKEYDIAKATVISMFNSRCPKSTAKIVWAI